MKVPHDLIGLLGRLDEITSVRCLVRHSAWYLVSAQEIVTIIPYKIPRERKKREVMNCLRILRTASERR